METLLILTLFWGAPIYFVLRLKPDHLLLCLSGLWLFLHVLSLLESPGAAPGVWDFLLDGLFYVSFWFGISIAKDVAFAAFRRGRQTESDEGEHDEENSA